MGLLRQASVSPVGLQPTFCPSFTLWGAIVVTVPGVGFSGSLASKSVLRLMLGALSENVPCPGDPTVGSRAAALFYMKCVWPV